MEDKARSALSLQFNVKFESKEKYMAKEGTVKWFSPTKGYGFIQPSDGGSDVFVHITAVQKAGLETLNENQKVNFDLTQEKGKTSAIDIRTC